MLTRRPLLSLAALALASALSGALFAGEPREEGAAEAPAVTAPDISPERLGEDVRALSAPDMAGRPAGGSGGADAARYLAQRIASAGAAPLGDEAPGATVGRQYAQAFEFTAGVDTGGACALALGLADGVTTLRLDEDYRPLGFSSTGEARSDVVFCGYGITANSQGWDDYAGVDVEGRIVVVLDGLPGGGREGTPLGSSLVRYGQVRYKAMNAREHGAAGMLVVASEKGDGGEDPQLVGLSRRASQGDAGIVCADLRRSIVTGWKSTGGATIGELQERIDESGAPASGELEAVTAHIRVELVKERRGTENVLAWLEGSDPALRDEVIVIGAHYDHLGDGSLGGSLSEVPGIHHGADDNASGCAAVLEVARQLARSEARPRRSVLFAFFGAEELGLLGSAHYVKNPVVPLERTVAMLNLDMVGRMKGRNLSVGGVGTAGQWPALVEAAGEGLDIAMTLDQEGFGPSDHSSFYGKEIPVLFLFTGAHEDYHKPSDTFDKVNVDGLALVTRLAYEIVREIDALDARPTYEKTKGSAHGGQLPGRGPSVYLGTIPDYAESEIEGLRIQGVRDGSPAAKAGLQAGDVVVRFDGKDVRDVYDYTYALFAKKPGEVVEIVVLRDGERVTCTATMGRKGGAKPKNGEGAHAPHPTDKSPHPPAHGEQPRHPELPEGHPPVEPSPPKLPKGHP
jgi:hypothetical protein